MFEVVISQVKTGRVSRAMFDTREQAEHYMAAVEDRLTNPPQKNPDRLVKPKSLRDYRIEIHIRDRPAVAQPAAKARRPRALAA